MSRLHPFTLGALAITLPALAWILPAPGGGLTTATLALTLAATAGPRRALVPAVIGAAPFWLFLFLLQGWSGALVTAPRLTTMVASFIWLVAVLPPARLVEAMVARAWPIGATFLASATLSAGPVLRERARRIVDAQRCRGLPVRGGLLIRARALRALALPLVLSALHEVEERALALETRGLAGGARRTALHPPADAAVERIARWGLVALVATALIWRLT